MCLARGLPPSYPCNVTNRSSVSSMTAKAGPSRVLPGVLDAAVGHLVGAEGRHLVDQDAAELEGSGRLQPSPDIAGEDAGLEAELRVVGEAQRLVEVRVAVDRRHRAEDLLAPDLGLVRRRAEQGRRQAAALVDQLALR